MRPHPSLVAFIIWLPYGILYSFVLWRVVRLIGLRKGLLVDQPIFVYFTLANLVCFVLVLIILNVLIQVG